MGRILEIQTPQDGSKLTHLDFSLHSESITDHILWEVAQNCQDLKSINLSGCNEISPLGLRSLSMGIGYTLEKIDFTSCINFTDMFINVLTVRFFSLKSISLSRCTQLSNSSLQALSRGCNATLEELNLSFCTQLSEEALFWLSGTMGSADSACKVLSTINLQVLNFE